MSTKSPSLNQEKADAFKHHMMQVTAGAMLMTSLRLGHEIGLFRALNKNGPLSSQDLAKACNISPRYAYEWCLHTTANGILEYNDEKDTFALPPEHAIMMDTNEGMLPMMCSLVENMSYQYPMLKLAYETDGGIFWGDMRGLREGAKLFFKPVYEQLLPTWIPLHATLKQCMSDDGAKIADVGCGCGISTKSLAKQFPSSQVLGIDYHQESIDNAKQELSEFENADAKVIDSHTWADEEEEASFSVVTMFDCFHDMADPQGVAQEAYKALKPGGVIFLIEPYSSKEDTTKAKLSMLTVPVFSGFSACCCTACGKTVPGKEGLGTTAGTDRYEALFKQVGFTSFETFGEKVEGPTSPTAAGFRLMLATK